MKFSRIAALASAFALSAAAAGGAATLPQSGTETFTFGWFRDPGPIDFISGDTSDTSWTLDVSRSTWVTMLVTDTGEAGDEFDLVFQGRPEPWSLTGTVPGTGQFTAAFRRQVETGEYSFSLEVTEMTPVRFNGFARATFIITPVPVPIPLALLAGALAVPLLLGRRAGNFAV